MRDILLAWERSQMSQAALRVIQRDSGVPARLAETVFHQVDTLDTLSGLDWLVFKGGTCVQSHLPYDKQRASVDLDLNSTMGNPNSIMDEVNALNRRLADEGRTADVQGVTFGAVEYQGTDDRTGTVNYIRRMPSVFGEFERVGKDLIQSKSLRLQVNYKHSWLPSIRVIDKAFDPFIRKYQEPASSKPFPHSSPQDLMADKILTTSVIGDFGRERYKDIYDLYQLSRLVGEFEPVLEKLDLVSGESGLTVGALLDASVETVDRFSVNFQEAGGFLTMVCKGGRQDMEDWEGACGAVVDVLKLLKQAL